jgi:hypothetical protein
MHSLLLNQNFFFSAHRNLFMVGLIILKSRTMEKYCGCINLKNTHLITPPPHTHTHTKPFFNFCTHRPTSETLAQSKPHCLMAVVPGHIKIQVTSFQLTITVQLFVTRSCTLKSNVNKCFCLVHERSSLTSMKSGRDSPNPFAPRFVWKEA